MRVNIDYGILNREYETWGKQNRNADDLRFGQYMYNKYGDSQPWPELFYQEDRFQCFKLLTEYLLHEENLSCF